MASGLYRLFTNSLHSSTTRDPTLSDLVEASPLSEMAFLRMRPPAAPTVFEAPLIAIPSESIWAASLAAAFCDTKKTVGPAAQGKGDKTNEHREPAVHQTGEWMDPGLCKRSCLEERRGERKARSKLLFTVCLVEDPDASLPRTASAPRVRKEDLTLWEFAFAWPLRPPGLSVASRMRSSRSMRPALRKAFPATERLPEGGAELDKDMGWATAADLQSRLDTRERWEESSGVCGGVCSQLFSVCACRRWWWYEREEQWSLFSSGGSRESVPVLSEEMAVRARLSLVRSRGARKFQNRVLRNCATQSRIR